MKRRIIWFFAASLLVWSGVLHAEVKCFPEQIKSVQVYGAGSVYYTTVSGVKRRLTHFSQYGAQGMFDLLRESINTVQIIQVVYPDGYNCKQPDLEVDALSVLMREPRVN